MRVGWDQAGMLLVKTKTETKNFISGIIQRYNHNSIRKNYNDD
jgi:hypothetical protein